MKFSACWIVKNEADNIKASINSVRDCAEEMIVVDTGSDDGTVRAANECGARVEHFIWDNDFSTARNYALSLASGEFVIFLDADEYFYPALTKADRDKLEKLFAEKETDCFGLYSIEIDKSDGVLRDLCIRERLLRRSAVHYQGRIHETTALADGSQPKSVLLENYAMVHTGYSRDVAALKIKRNLDILEEEQKNLKDPLKRYLNAMYLLRESFLLMDLYKASDYCIYLFAHHELHAAAYKFSPEGFIRNFYHAVNVIELKRGKFNRREVYDKLFRVMKERRPDSRDGLLAGLHYQLRFDYRDDRFLRELAEVEPKLPAEFQMDIPDRRVVEGRIYEQASEAAHMRGDRRTACLYAYRSMECIPAFERRALLLLLYSLKDHSLTDAERILKSAAIPGRPNIADKVISILKSKGEREKYFQNAELQEIFKPEPLQPGIAGAKLSEPERIALFRQSAEKHFARMRYADILAEPDASLAAAKRYVCAYYVAYAHLMREEYTKAYAVVAPHIESGMTNQELLSILLVTAGKLPEPLAAQAGKLYEESISILNENVDLNDFVSTDAVYGADAANQKRTLREMKQQAFEDGLTNDISKPVSEPLLIKHKEAIPVFIKNGCVLMAAESYRLLTVKGCDTEYNISKLSELFYDNGNYTLAKNVKGVFLNELRTGFNK